MIYVYVLLGSFLGMCAILCVRVALRNRGVRKFVRSIRRRTDEASQRGFDVAEESPVARPKKNPRLSAIDLQQVRTLVRKAEKESAQGNTEEAERAYIQALTILPDAYDVQAQLAKFYLQTVREAKAEAMYRELLLKYDDISFYANLGLAYYRQGKFVDACHAYQEALNRDPKNPDRSAALGRACIAAHRFEEAAPLLEKACTRLTRDTQLLALLAECYLQLGDAGKAEEAYRRINKMEPYNEMVKQKLSQLTHQ